MKQHNKNRSIIYGIVITLMVTLILLGLTYAYYRTKVMGNSGTKSISTLSKNLVIEYSDDKTVVEADDIVPGREIEKEFQVINKGDETDYFSIKIENVENTFDRREDWTYILYKENEEIKKGMLPNTESWLVYKETITGGETINYKLKIIYANLINEDQSEDMGKKISFKINIDNEIDNGFTTAEKGTLLNAIARDNAISETLTKPGNASPFRYYDNGMNETIKTATISTENQTKNYITYADKYTVNPEKGYSLVNPQVGKYSEIYNKLAGKYVGSVTGSINEGLSSYQNLQSIYQIKSATIENSNNITYIQNNWPVKGIEQELSYTEDDDGTSYYFRGAVENNFVTFNNMCWRVVRVQGDLGIKLVLFDNDNACEDITKENPTGAFINSGQRIGYTSSIDGADPGCLAFEKSNIPPILDTWMKEKELDTNEKIDEAKWCNDISIYQKSDTEFSYGTYARGSSSSLKCDFTGIDDSKARIYEKRVGLLTNDEVTFAGAGGVGPGYLLGNFFPLNASGGSWFTLTPGSLLFRGAGIVFVVNTEGGLSTVWSGGSYTYRVRPSIVLNSNVTISPDSNGTQQNPYILSVQ